MKTCEVRTRWDDKQAKRMGVKYPGRHLVKETKVVNPGYVKQSLRTA